MLKLGQAQIRKRISLQRGRPMPATAPNQQWSMDFEHDQMLDGRSFRVLTVIDQWSRESVTLEANYRLTGRCVGKALDEAALERGWPKAITVDNGTEFTSKALDEWAWRRGVKLDYTRPGKPTDNGLITVINHKGIRAPLFKIPRLSPDTTPTATSGTYR